MSVDILKKVERGELMQDPRHITSQAELKAPIHRFPPPRGGGGSWYSLLRSAGCTI